MDKLLKLREQGWFIAIDVPPPPVQFGWLLARPGFSKSGRTNTLQESLDTVYQLAIANGAVLD